MHKQRSAQDHNDMSDLEHKAPTPGSALEEGKVFDYITGKQVKESDKERVRQRIARALIHEYGIAAEDMEPDFKIKLLGKNRKIDIGIFKPGQPHTEDNLYRAVVVEKEPKIGTKGAYRMRDPEEARKEFELLETVMAEVDSCDYGLWTNGLEFFFFKKEVTRFDTKFKPIGDWPLGDDTFSVEGRSMGRVRRAERRDGKRRPGPSFLSHLVTVDSGHDRRRLSGKIDEDSRRRSTVLRAVIDAGEHDEARQRRKVERNRQQNRDRRRRPDTW